jgi:hypothetical protein
MPSQSRLLRSALALLFAPTASLLVAQTQAPVQAPVNPDITPSLSHLGDQPATHTGFVFDRTMLQAARSLLEANGMDAQRAAVALSSISYENYHYPEPPVYSPVAMDSIRAAYHAAGWKHLVNGRDLSRDVNRGANATRDRGSDVPSPNPPAPSDAPVAAAHHSNQITDLWLHVTAGDIDGVTVITRGVRNVNVVQIACDLRPLDLVGLSGHFGIPRVDPNAVMVPAPDNRQIKPALHPARGIMFS